MEKLTLLPILKKIPLFADLDSREHEAIIEHIVMNYYPTGYVFFNEGEPGAAMFILKNGMVKISRKDKNNESAPQEVAVLSANDFFGEMALVLNEPRNATATAVSDCEVFQLNKEDFAKLLETTPSMASKLSAEFLARMKKNERY